MNKIKIVLFLIILFASASGIKASSEYEQELTENKLPIYTVTEVQRYSDLDTDQYFFKLILNNYHFFNLEVTLNDLINKKIYKDQDFLLISESFIKTQPGKSAFIYESLDASIQLKGEFDSINSNWQPDGSENIVTIVRKDGYYAMGRFYNLIYFSDNSYTNNRDMFLNAEIGDSFFQIKPPKGQNVSFLVGIKDGRLILDNNDNKRFITVNWH